MSKLTLPTAIWLPSVASTVILLPSGVFSAAYLLVLLHKSLVRFPLVWHRSISASPHLLLQPGRRATVSRPNMSSWTLEVLFVVVFTFIQHGPRSCLTSSVHLAITIERFMDLILHVVPWGLPFSTTIRFPNIYVPGLNNAAPDPLWSPPPTLSAQTIPPCFYFHGKKLKLLPNELNLLTPPRFNNWFPGPLFNGLKVKHQIVWKFFGHILPSTGWRYVRKSLKISVVEADHVNTINVSRGISQSFF